MNVPKDITLIDSVEAEIRPDTVKTGIWQNAAIVQLRTSMSVNQLSGCLSRSRRPRLRFSWRPGRSQLPNPLLRPRLKKSLQDLRRPCQGGSSA